MPRFVALRSLALAGAAGLALAACGTSGSSTAPGPAPTPSTTATASASVTASHDASSVQLRQVTGTRVGKCAGAATQPDPSASAAICDPSTGTTYLLAKADVVGGVLDAVASMPANQVAWSVTVSFDPEASAQLARVTTQLAGSGQQLAMVVEGRVVSAPTVESPITGGRLTIAGTFTKASAESLARALSR